MNLMADSQLIDEAFQQPIFFRDPTMTIIERNYYKVEKT